MTEIKNEGSGSVRISDEVIMKIASSAALEADGVLRTARKQGGKAARKNPAKCTSVVVKDKTVSIGMMIAVGFGAKIHEVSHDVQKRIKAAVETMTGLHVAEVNVSVAAIVEQSAKNE
jgi:uncharacterized alkaline shock family protein YloU